MLSPRFFFSAPLIAPRTEWPIQPVALVRSSSVAPFLPRNAAISSPSLLLGLGIAERETPVGVIVLWVAPFRLLSGDFFQGLAAGEEASLGDSIPTAARPA